MHRLALALCLASIGFGQGLTGEWEFKLVRFHTQNNWARITFDDKLNGKAFGDEFVASIKGSSVEIRLTEDGKNDGILTGTLSGDEMHGEGTINGGAEKVEWSAKRFIAKTAAPKTHQFTPETFHNYFSSSIPPALHLNPGDTVETKSVDAGGADEKGVRRAPGGNPLTGPFYVEGALPGDVLVVKINRLRLNGTLAHSGTRVSPNSLNPYYLRDLKFDDKIEGEWKLDTARGVATLTKPTDRLKNFEVKLKPMLGCIGVAPPGDQSYRSGFLGSYGGNMDYNQFGEGVTFYFPVFQPGALLFLGDGHAAQGDGELTGDALETATEYSFTVDIVRNKRIPMPRSENAQFRMASGIANSLQEAVAAATTNLAQWLTDDYKLNANEVALVLGTSVKYDIAELVDPLVHVVAKIEKSVLEKIR
jgi:acetamidase/formamidase